MKTHTRIDPNGCCDKVEHSLLYAVLHDLISHPLLVISFYSEWSIRFHNWTSRKAWPVRKKTII
jgi:hypothetical protein